jgi:O-antigen polymerase
MKNTKAVVLNILIGSTFFILLFPPIRDIDSLFNGKDIVVLSVFSFLLMLAPFCCQFDKLRKIDFVMIAFNLYSIYKTYDINTDSFNNNLLIFSVAQLFFWFFRFKQASLAKESFFLRLCYLLLFFNLLISFAQYFQIIRSVNPTFPITGTFINPGPFSIYIVALCSFSANYLFGKEVYSSKIGVFLFTGCTLVCLTIVSRTAIVGMTICLIVIKAQTIKEYLRSNKVLAIVLSMTTLPIIYILYQLKPVSANTRLFIWRCCLDVIHENLWFGVGSKFGYLLSKSQIKLLEDKFYFENYASQISDSYYTFNDLLRMTGEGGVVHLTLFGLIAGFTIKNSIQSKDRFKRALAVTLITLLVSSLFSYPLGNLTICCFYWSIIGILANRADQEKTFDTINCGRRHLSSIFFLCILTLVGVWIGFYTLIRAGSLLRFQRLNHNFSNITTELYETELIKLYGSLSYNHMFITKLAQAKSFIGKDQESIMLFQQAKMLIPLKELYYSRGLAFQKIKKYKEAELEYREVEKRLPNLIYPKYLLAKLYYDSGQISKWNLKAKEVIEFKPKIESGFTLLLKKKIRKRMKN